MATPRAPDIFSFVLDCVTAGWSGMFLSSAISAKAGCEIEKPRPPRRTGYTGCGKTKKVVIPRHAFCRGISHSFDFQTQRDFSFFFGTDKKKKFFFPPPAAPVFFRR